MLKRRGETPSAVVVLPLDGAWCLLMRLDVTEHVGPPSLLLLLLSLALGALLGLLGLRRLLVPGGVGSALVALLLELLLGLDSEIFKKQLGTL